MIRGRSRAWLKHLVMPLAGLAVIGYVLYEMDSAAKIMGTVWIALGLVYFAVHTMILKKPAAIDL
jgi:hypothetical protein